MAECRDCDASNVHWGKTKEGKPILMESVPHFPRCKAFKARRKAKSEDMAIDKLFSDPNSPEAKAVKKLIREQA